MTKDDPALTVEQELEQAAKYAAWRVEVADRLNDANRWTESNNFRHCGDMMGNFQVLVCADDPTHEAKAIPFTCHLRYCPDCAARRSAELAAKYVPILKELADDVDHPTWSLKKIVLTTPYSLLDPRAGEYLDDALKFVDRWLQLVFKFYCGDLMTADEKRRGRFDYTPHGVGGTISVEFGEKGYKLHFHILMLCPWMSQKQLCNLWLEATGGEASVTDIRAVAYGDVEQCVREMVKYVTKFNNLPPTLVVKLADVLDGVHRFKTFGVVRGAAAPEPEPTVCKHCSAKITVMLVSEYFRLMVERNVEPDAAIAAAGASIFLQFKRGNKVGEAGVHLARDAPTDVPEQVNLPFLDAIATRKKPFQYH